jgi:hypothetical protein
MIRAEIKKVSTAERKDQAYRVNYVNVKLLERQLFRCAGSIRPKKANRAQKLNFVTWHYIIKIDRAALHACSMQYFSIPPVLHMQTVSLDVRGRESQMYCSMLTRMHRYMRLNY